MDNWTLRSVMFTDIIGYTALSGENRVRGLKVRDANENIHRKLVPEYGGEIINSWGDGVLASFDSAIGSVRCAIEIQKSIISRDYQLRIGIDLGDVSPAGNNLNGNCVNISNRIQELGIPQSILMSSRVRDQVFGIGDIVLHGLGSITLKNVIDLQDLYCLMNDGLQIPRIPSENLPLAFKPLSRDELIILEYLNNPLTQRVGGANDVRLALIVENNQHRLEAIESLFKRGFIGRTRIGVGVTREGSNYIRK